MTRPTRLAVAMHEAGHAVIRAIMPGAPPVQWVTLEDLPDDQLGRTFCEAMWQPSRIPATGDESERAGQWKTFAWEDVIFYLAGPIAELRWRRNCRSAIWFFGPEMADRCFGPDAPEPISDLGQVRRRISWLHPAAERTCAFNRAWLEAESRVAAHIHVINWVGRMLSECGELSGEDVHEIVERFIPPLAGSGRSTTPSQTCTVIAELTTASRSDNATRP